jgi:hypothetical protein
LYEVREDYWLSLADKPIEELLGSYILGVYSLDDCVGLDQEAYKGRNQVRKASQYKSAPMYPSMRSFDIPLYSTIPLSCLEDDDMLIPSQWGLQGEGEAPNA